MLDGYFDRLFWSILQVTVFMMFVSITLHLIGKALKLLSRVIGKVIAWIENIPL